ncbi:hypothetical protein WMY93_028229 [Mugilogobius chulae]|uniref:Uncharacterized protein n=1 Tax=Mugilogobius chulae TaxID=88201 RepID=A0AAW0MRC5_9GOBI
MRANGTIHFGVMDKVKGLYRHGEIIGIDVQNREDFVDALDYIEKCFKTSNEQCDARKCIRIPQFIEVIEKETKKKTYVIEYDVVPTASIVKKQYYSVGVPKFTEKEEKIKFDNKVPYCRVGANTPRVSPDDLFSFIESLIEKDKQREEAESTKDHTTVEYQEDQRRKLSILLTAGRKLMDDSLFYIIVTNKFDPQHQEHITFLVNMNTVCVFDFDPDSLETGLCAAFRKQKAVTPHFLNDYLNEEQSNLSDFKNKLGLFDKTSWIFCNGRNHFHQKEEPCDDKTWIKTRKKKLKKAVSFICNDLLPRKSFIVLFMLMSDVEQPLVETFSEFYEEMNGHESIVILSESKENHKKWSSLAQVFCPTSTLNEISVTGMPISHMDATVQSIQLSKNQTTRTLPASSGGVCSLKSADEAMLHSLEIISVDQCENTNLDIMDKDEINKIEKHFYHGGKIDWIHFWLSDKHKCGDIIKRDAFHDTNNILEGIIPFSHGSLRPIESVNILHHPGSGGSTVARQLLWHWKNKVGRDEFLKFIKALVIRRNKKSKGDPDNTAFSPLIEHITGTDGLPKAIELMTDAYRSLGKDGIVAQQLARLLYTNQRFEEALEWAKIAKSCLPCDTFVLDTLGQVYKRWFYHLFDSLEEEPSPEGGVEIISTALKAISAFRDSEKTPKKETASLNSSYYGRWTWAAGC